MGALKNYNQEDLKGLSIRQVLSSTDDSTTELYALFSQEQQHEINDTYVVDSVVVSKQEKKWARRYVHGCFLSSLYED